MTNPINGALPPPPKQIRFVNNQGQPPSKRRRINAAYVSHLRTLPIPSARMGYPGGCGNCEHRECPMARQPRV